MLAEASIGYRLDRLPLSRFHWRLLGLVPAGMLFDLFDIYIAGSVLAAMIHSGESTLQLNAGFVSATFIGMMAGAWLSGLLGDRFGRRFSYQFSDSRNSARSGHESGHGTQIASIPKQPAKKGIPGHANA